MNDLAGNVAILAKPYSITRSRLGAITKVYPDQFFCDLPSLKELFQNIGEKLISLPPTGTPEFSFLISFSDKTHQDGVITDLNGLTSIPIGKQTDRIVMKWVVQHEIEGLRNELTVTIRISNPINPLVFLQAALSKSPNDLDNFEFEMGSTCVTVDGAGQSYADEVFLRVQNWMNARNKPHAFIGIHESYLKYQWIFDQLNLAVLPLLTISAICLYLAQRGSTPQQLTAIPIVIGLFLILRDFARKANDKMQNWAHRAKHINLFQITNGDIDALTKIAARSKNSLIKLGVSGAASFLINVAAGVTCWYFLGAG